MQAKTKGPHSILTENGVEGACSAALCLMKHPNADILYTSPRHIPTALAAWLAGTGAGTLHVCGIGIGAPVEEILHVLSQGVKPRHILWYTGRAHPELTGSRKSLERFCTLRFSKAASDTAAMAEHLGLTKVAQVLLTLELAEDACAGRKPRSEFHGFCHDLVLAANRRFYFFGDDTLNEKAIRYLAGQVQRTRELEEAVEEYRHSEDALYPLGSSCAMKDLRQQVGRLGPVPEPVLIVGPTGSGKEVMAKALHVTSGRKGAFVAVNCAVLGGNPTLVEDRLFGHVKGAYTGAVTDAKGAFEEAHGGTLFLDEIAELPVEVQSQLLRVAEEKTFRPLGTMAARRADVRIVVATHRDLPKMVAEGTFREDLFYRLNVLALRVPPLRERPDDMRSIAAHVAEELKKSGYPLNLGKADWDALRGFEWPGNVRQFLNVLKRAAYLGRPIAETLDQECAWQRAAGENELANAMALYRPNSPDEVAPAGDVYQDYLNHVLGLFGGNVTRAARALEIAPNTLRKHVDKR